MKKILALSILILSVSSVYAENLFQTNNPFPQTMPQSMNNIYESKPAVIQQEAKQAKKSWFRKGKNLQNAERAELEAGKLPTYPAGDSSNGSFYMFK